MIRVTMQAEPQKFEREVRKPGKAYLAKVPNPTSKQFQTHAYWTRIGREIYLAYGKVCAYTCHYIAPDTGSRHVDHFVAKTRKPALAYEWSNYRLACGLVNSRKGTAVVLDPFTIQDGWFVINFPSLLVKPDSTLSASDQIAVKYTIDKLRLNDEVTCVQARMSYIRNYCQGRIDFEHLRKEAPFLGMELERQDLVDDIKKMMKF